jgi:hypothetical protein
LHTSLVDIPPVTTAIVNTTAHSLSPKVDKISSSNRDSKPSFLTQYGPVFEKEKFLVLSTTGLSELK